jgi:hypothetical protein
MQRQTLGRNQTFKEFEFFFNESWTRTNISGFSQHCCHQEFVHPMTVDMIMHSIVIVCRYLNAIQTMCPHILRYLTTAVITNRRRRQAYHHQLLKDLVRVIQQVMSRNLRYLVLCIAVKKMAVAWMFNDYFKF